MKKKKSIFSTFMVIILIFAMCLPIVAFAADVSDSYNKQIEGHKQSIEAIMNQINSAGETETYETYKRMYDYLFSDATKDKFLQDGENHYTIKSGYEVIDEVIENSNSLSWWEIRKNINLEALKSIWKKQFRTSAEAYGIEYGNVFNSQGDHANEIENASIKVNLLTWNRDKKNDGTAIKSLEQGVIMKFLKAFDSYSGFTTWIRGIAIALTIAFGCSQILMMTMDKNASTEALQRELIMIIFGIWVIMNYKFFALLIIRLGTIITEKVMVVDFTSEKGKYVYLTLCQSFDEIVNAYPDITSLGIMNMQGGNLVASITNFGSNFMSSITNLVGGGLVQLASSLTVYSVIIEIGIRYLFTPIAIADLYSEKFRSNGWTWLKKLFAVSLQGAVIFMIIYATDVFKQAIDTTSIITLTAINLTMIGMFAKSRQIANDMIGVH